MFFSLFHPPVHMAPEPDEDRVLSNFFDYSWGPSNSNPWLMMARRTWFDLRDCAEPNWTVLGAWCEAPVWMEEPSEQMATC